MARKRENSIWWGQNSKTTRKLAIAFWRMKVRTEWGKTGVLDCSAESAGEGETTGLRVTLPNLFSGFWQENKVMNSDVSAKQDIQVPGLQEASRRVRGTDAKISLMPFYSFGNNFARAFTFMKNNCFLGHFLNKWHLYG